MFKLIIGNKNFSSWSLRPWLVLKMLDEPFEELSIDLLSADVRQRIDAVSPTGKVPVLRDRNLIIADSLAICEYLAECFPSAHLWPQGSDERAQARSVCAEMHAGFAHLREKLPMDICARLPQPVMTPELEREIGRIGAIWQELRTRHEPDGPFLFGPFTIADAFFAPVITRFVSYGIALSGLAREYADTVLALPAMQDWIEAAERETSGAAGAGSLE